MEFGLFQQQSTSLVMTQELSQAIRLLQYSAADLTEYLQEQALENPLLDVQEQPDEKVVKEEFLDVHAYPVYEPSGREERMSPLDYAVIDRRSLNDHLIAQLTELRLSHTTKKVITYFIYSLREDGYFSRPFEEVCQEAKITVEQGAELLEILQRFEPAGVGARNLQECLLLQLERLPQRQPLAEKIVQLYMEEFARRKWKEVSLALDVTLYEIQQVNDLIQTLDPRPGLQFSAEPIPFVTPEIKIFREQDRLHVQLNDELIPTIRLNTHYERLLLSSKDQTASNYAKEKVQQVHWLIRSIQQRQQTIIKVGEAIAKHQVDYFLHNGVLKPLTLKQIADEIGVHESTVSRATTNKYAETPRGVIELKALFSSAVKAGNGDSTSSQSIKEHMKQLIAKENKQKPLSDAKIVAELKAQEGITVSRRAIAKYRDELGIPSSSKRKRFE